MNARRGVLLALVFLPLASAQAEITPLDRVPIRYVPPTLVVEARVNGSAPLLFAFDTATTTIVLDAGAAKRLGIRSRRLAPKTPQGQFARARSLAVGKAVAYDLEVVLRDLSGLARRLQLDLAGILGYTWMEQFIFEIDYAAGTLSLWPRQTDLSPAADTLVVPLELRTAPGFTGAAVFVSAQLNRRLDCRCELDTGTDTGILGAAIARQLGADVAPPSGATASGRRSLPRHRVETLALGGRLFANVAFRVDPARGADGHPYLQCVIGNEQLREFVLTLDIPHRRAFFRPAPRPEPRR
ncbi:MAG: aspartyl protease family protein [Terriglobia bacterium]